MRRFLNSKLTILALVILVLSLISGVAWAATSPSSSSSPSSNDGVHLPPVEIVAIPLELEVGGKLQVAAAGLEPGNVVIFEIIVGGGSPNLILQGGNANDAGAFLVNTTKAFRTGGLPEFLVPGIYTIAATTLVGGQAVHVASAPLVIVEQKIKP